MNATKHCTTWDRTSGSITSRATSSTTALQFERAKAFDKSCNYLMQVITSKSAALQNT